MNIIRKLTQRFLKLNRTRTLVTIIGVIISTAMITAVPTLMMSYLNAYQQATIDSYGNWHVQYLDIESSKAARISADENTAWASLIRLDGFAELENSRSTFKPYLSVLSMDKNAMGTLGLKLIEGRLPVSANEAVLSIEALRMGGMDVKLGDSLDLETGRRWAVPNEFQDERELGLYQNYVESGTNQPPTEELRLDSRVSVKVVGFVKQPPTESYFNPGFSVIRYLDANKLAATDKVDVMVTWKRVTTQANNHANRLGESFGVPTERINYNAPLVQAYGILSVRNMATLYLLIAVLIIVIVIGSVFLISNAFNISVVERSRQYGLLASVGATVAQKKQAVYSEAWLIALVAIPIGIAAGIGGIALTLRFVEPLLNSLMSGNEMNLAVKVTPGLILVAALFALMIIFLSAMSPARRAAKVSPIDAIRQTQDIKIKSSQVKTSRLLRTLFGFEGELALKNIKRNSKGYVTTILSLVVSIVLFLGVFSMAKYSFGAMDSRVVNFTYPISVVLNSKVNDEERADFYAEIVKLEGVGASVFTQSDLSTIIIDKNRVQDEMLQRNWEAVAMEVGPGEIALPANLEIVPAEFFNLILEKNHIQPIADIPDALEVIMVNPVMKVNKGGNIVEQRYFDVEGGQSLKLELMRYSEEKQSQESQNAELSIAGFVDVNPLNDGFEMDNSLNFLVSREDYEQLTAFLNFDSDLFRERLLLDSANTTKTVKEIEDLQLKMRIGETFITDRNLYQKSDYNLRIVVNVFFYGFVVLIALIGLTNILNTILTGMRLRQREFAMLRSVGMTPGSFNKMLQFESLYFGVMALLIGLPLGVGLNFVFFIITQRSFDVKFQIPWLAIGIVIVVVLIVTMAVMQFSSRQAKKANIVETMRMEAI